MFARTVSIRLKPNGIAEFSRVMEKETIPLLRKQKGFHDEITFFVPDGREAVEISLWDRKEDADAYGRRTSPKVLKALENVIEGDSEVRIYAVSNSTFHKIAAPVFGRS
jgi:heme-degrading monooxygenase HmoA